MTSNSHGAMRFAATLMALLLSLALAQRVAPGTKLLLTDLNSETIVGYGAVEGHELELSLSRGTREFALLLIQPDGSVTSYRGERVGGVLRLESDGRQITLQALLRRAGIGFRLTEVRPGAPLSAPGEDDHSLAGGDDDGSGDNAGPGEESGSQDEGSDEDEADDHSGHGGGDDDAGNDDNSGHGSGDDEDGEDHSGPGGGGDDGGSEDDSSHDGGSGDGGD